MIVKVVNHSGFPLPHYATVGSVGLDLRAAIAEPLVIQPMKRALLQTGISIGLPTGYEAQVRPRSGLAAKFGVFSIFGTIDEDYTGEIKVNLMNFSEDPFTVQPGERIAQLVISRYEKIEWETVEVLAETSRGAQGFGSTGRH